MSLSVLPLKKKQLIIQNKLLRRFLISQNFFQSNLKITEQNFNYLACISLNGLTAEKIHNLRIFLRKFGFSPTQYSTKFFLFLLKKYYIFLNEKHLNQFYLGQMLIIFINFKEISRFRLKQEEIVLNFLKEYMQILLFRNNKDSSSSSVIVITSSFLEQLLKEKKLFLNKYVSQLNLIVISFFSFFLFILSYFIQVLQISIKSNKLS